MSTGDLKPCPFCGGEAKPSGERFENTILSWVYCTNCGAAGGYRHTEAEAIEAWNTRAETVTVTGITTVTNTPQITYVPERTCKNNDTDDDSFFRCSECDNSSVTEFLRSGYGVPRYCPNCGSRVVE